MSRSLRQQAESDNPLALAIIAPAAQFGQFASLLFFTIISSHYIHETVAAVIMSVSYQQNGLGSKPPNPQFRRRAGAKVWSILLLDTFLNFQPDKPTLDFVDSAG